MEPCPEPGQVILQRFGNSSHYYEINGTELSYGKTELPEGVYQVTSNTASDLPNVQLNLSGAASGYVLGLFDSPLNRLVFMFWSSQSRWFQTPPDFPR
ncbi:unnamed protein product [Gongylonema pulchrum]|uniref:Thermopsin n=1 Tax=Gongylonema pulchrum TaxID=637853 RepID=A0A183ELA4_9BILA|nr:unnamed protein product [Gongylonema pulchrum]